MFEQSRIFVVFTKSFVIRLAAAAVLASIYSVSVAAQAVGPVQYKSQEVSEVDGIPVLMKHLPDWENKRGSASIATTQQELRRLIGDRPIADSIELSPGSEAVAADYDVGRLVIIEHPSPQASVEADQKISVALVNLNDGKTFYKRIGNYNVIVFDATGRSGANSLIDKVKYEKNITWLGKNPFAISAERAFIMTTSDIFFSTLMVIVGGVVFSILGGLVVGFVFFSRRDRRRADLTTFTDGGGMTRLNLDGFTSEAYPDRLLGD